MSNFCSNPKISISKFDLCTIVLENFLSKGVQKLDISLKNRLRGRRWCTRILNWTAPDNWPCLLFSDESKFNLAYCGRRVSLWSIAGEKYTPECVCMVESFLRWSWGGRESFGDHPIAFFSWWLLRCRIVTWPDSVCELPHIWECDAALVHGGAGVLGIVDALGLVAVTEDDLV